MLGASFKAVASELLRPVALIRYLVLKTEVHAYCASLAFFAMVAFYPLSLLFISVSKYAFMSESAHTAVQELIRALYPTSQEFLLRNLEASSWQFGEAVTVQAGVWVLLGAAGVFIPLETALNGLWGFEAHRPYWRNQLVGFLLVLAGCGLALPAVWGLAAMERWPQVLPAIALIYVSAALFLLYRFLPNGPVSSVWALPAAVLGTVALAAVQALFVWSLPYLALPESQGPYHVSISFLLLAYFEAFAIFGAAFVTTQAAHRFGTTPPSVRLRESGEE
ncbi:MAG: YihY/virulence factor BrkB family protein [Vicinamibacteria bacterium]